MDMNYKFRHEMLSEEAWRTLALKVMLLVNEVVGFCPDEKLREELDTHRQFMKRALDKYRSAPNFYE